MARPSPITIGLSVLMAAILTLGIFVVMRPRHAQPTTTAESTPEPAPPAARVMPPPPAPAAPPAPPAPRAAVPAPPATPMAVAVPDDPATAAPPPVPGPRAALVKNHNQRLVEADEEAIRALNLPAVTVTRIRAINEEHRQRSEADANTRQARETAQARVDALRLLLGNEGAQQFDKAERAAIRKLRGKYRFEWGQQGRERTK